MWENYHDNEFMNEDALKTGMIIFLVFVVITFSRELKSITASMA